MKPTEDRDADRLNLLILAFIAYRENDPGLFWKCLRVLDARQKCERAGVVEPTRSS